MENPNENEDPKRNQVINEELSRKSAEIKKKNSMVTEKLRDLKKQADELLKTDSATER